MSSLDAAQLEAAIRRDDAVAVCGLLRHASEGERAACRKALKPLLEGPGFPMPALIMTRPQDLADIISPVATGIWQLPAPAGDHAERMHEYEQWQKIADTFAFRLAALGLAAGVAAAAGAASDLQRLALHRLIKREPVADLGLAADVLADRAPSWLAAFADRNLRDDSGGFAWLLARTLVRRGAIDRPGVPEYTMLLPLGITWGYGGLNAIGKSPDKTPTLAQALLADAGLLEDEVWRLFTVPDAALALERFDHSTESARANGFAEAQTWAAALAQLGAQGHLDRGRLIDACLDAFTRDFNPNRVGWYATMLGQLDPSVAEIAARAPKYLGLLALTAKTAVTTGQQAARRLLDAGQLNPGQFIEASGPALLFPQKSVALAQLKLIDKLIAEIPATGPQAVVALSVAFGHHRQDVQEAALALIGKHGLPSGTPLGVVRLRARDLSPGLAAQAAALGLGPGTGQPADKAPTDSGLEEGLAAKLANIETRISAMPAIRAESLFAALDAARHGVIAGPAQVEPEAGALLPPPVTDPDELAQLLAMLMEDARDPVAAERALAGAVRLAGLPARQRCQAAAPLRKRAASVMNAYAPFVGDSVNSDMALIAHAWGGGQLPDDDDRDSQWWSGLDRISVSGTGRALSIGGIFSARAWEAAKIIEAGQGGLLLAEPETDRGVISPGSLFHRIRQLAALPGRPAAPHDQDIALLRLGPGADESLWDAWANIAGTDADALRATYRLTRGSLTFEAVAGTPPPLRGYYFDGQVLLARTTAAVPVAPTCPSWQLLTNLGDPVRDYLKVYSGQRFGNRQYDAVVASWALICPWQPELVAAHLLRPLSDGLKPGPSPAAMAIAALNHPGHPLGPVGHLALLTGLASAEADTRIAAAQLWTDACADGRLDPALAAAALITGVREQALKLNRIADSLQHASHLELAAWRIVETICRSASDLAPERPPNLHLLLELAARLGATVGAPELADAVKQLASRQDASRLTVTARQLLAARERPAPGRPAAAIQALTALAIRAET